MSIDFSVRETKLHGKTSWVVDQWNGPVTRFTDRVEMKRFVRNNILHPAKPTLVQLNVEEVEKLKNN
tara:strand:+ start:386 stop:586 length:201 start_codon:yes stop_codon:yes gene_type:complete